MYIVYLVDYRIGHFVIWEVRTTDLGCSDCVWMVPGVTHIQ